MQRKTAPRRSKRHRKLISMRFRRRRRERRLGETEQMGVRLREASRHSQLNKAPHIPSAPPHPRPLCVCASVCVWRACACARPPIYLESCDLTRAVMLTVWKAPLYIAGQCWVSQQSIVGDWSSLSACFLSSLEVRKTLICCPRLVW